MPDGMKEHLGNLAFDVFTRASNTGCAFHEAILSVYLTGLENGMQAERESGRKTRDQLLKDWTQHDCQAPAAEESSVTENSRPTFTGD
jgi:hypothetical protein